MVHSISKKQRFLLLTCILFLSLLPISAQQTNSVERSVANPLGRPGVKIRATSLGISKGQSDRDTKGSELIVYSEIQTVDGEDGKRILRHEGDVEISFQEYTLKADKVVIHEETGMIFAEGRVFLKVGESQQIGGEKGEWNFRSKVGRFYQATGFTDRTRDGSVIFFSAEYVERLSESEILVLNGKFTSCDEPKPKWSFTASKATILLEDSIKLENARFRLKDAPLIPIPGLSIPINRRDRNSGFLLPSVGYSPIKGFRASTAYFQTLGNSADATVRGELFSSRGIGVGIDLRTRANAKSFFDFGFYAVKDRILGGGASPERPNQGGSTVYADGVHYFSNGFMAAVDVRLTSNLEFRQVFSDGIQQIISSIEMSEAFVTKSWGEYTAGFLARSRQIAIPGVRVKTRNLPSVWFERRPSEFGFLRNIFFSFQSSLEGVSRREEVDSLSAYQKAIGGNPIVTPAFSRRLDLNPVAIIPIPLKFATVTVTAGGRLTHYSNSLDSMRNVTGNAILRKFGELEVDFRPVALARNFYSKKNGFRFRHVIEPYGKYKRVEGIQEFKHIIRFDEVDTISDTNEIEYGLVNRFYTRRLPGSLVTLQQGGAESEREVQPYEILSISVRGKYFFDKDFSGALVPQMRNQISAFTGLTYYSFGGVPRRFSPVNFDVTYRPSRNVFFSGRGDYGLDGDGLRTVSASIGYERKLVKIFQSFYYTRAVTLMPSLIAYSVSGSKEPGTTRGSQWNPSVFVGNRDKGLFGGTSFSFDFQNSRNLNSSPLISSIYSFGYAYNCCALAFQFNTFNVGVRQEKRFAFSVRLNGLGSFGTEEFGTGPRQR